MPNVCWVVRSHIYILHLDVGKKLLSFSLENPIPMGGGERTLKFVHGRYFSLWWLELSFKDLFSIFWINTQLNSRFMLSLKLFLDIHKMAPSTRWLLGGKESLFVLFAVRKGCCLPAGPDSVPWSSLAFEKKSCPSTGHPPGRNYWFSQPVWLAVWWGSSVSSSVLFLWSSLEPQILQVSVAYSIPPWVQIVHPSTPDTGSCFSPAVIHGRPNGPLCSSFPFPLWEHVRVFAYLPCPTRADLFSAIFFAWAWHTTMSVFLFFGSFPILVQEFPEDAFLFEPQTGNGQEPPLLLAFLVDLSWFDPRGHVLSLSPACSTSWLPSRIRRHICFILLPTGASPSSIFFCEWWLFDTPLLFLGNKLGFNDGRASKEHHLPEKRKYKHLIFSKYYCCYIWWKFFMYWSI